ncbi:MFS transporter [Paracidovorax valerianellae]|uniref:Predicted arabinose efflux permease, MFS family n=1 Tax=Paracidovorax valerianellae TaxID=187868 RepID=A0A1G6XI27_9BURK|nr:MFS transporter [Paracidovorax valerianellae]MDA8443467.1 MFS transporter [Paracidovorax valerianellae]SDD77712.1 Predicted arabinose efflux permease, MFS family [Paracidovorax valerianellae]
MTTEIPDAPPTTAGRLSAPLVLLLAVCCGVSVANVYYAQPLLDALALDFGIPPMAVGGVVTATQVGCALALLFVVALGDLVHRKRLLCTQLALLALALVGVAWAPTAGLLLVGMAAIGLLGTAMAQGLIAYAATLAHPSERGRVVGTVQGGVVIGLLMARVLAGAVTDLAGWRMVYVTSCVLSLCMWALLWKALPPARVPPAASSYGALLRSMATLLAIERVLQIRGVIGLLMFAAFSAFWSALVLPLSAPPYAMSHTAIGAFGLVGVVGALAAARAGHYADRGLGQRTTGIALACLLVSWVPIAFTMHSLWALAAGIVLLDLGGQAVHVVNQSMIFSSQPQAHSRLVGCYMLFYAAGSGLGAIASTSVYAHAGWLGVCALGFGISLAALLFWAATLRAMPAHRG